MEINKSNKFLIKSKKQMFALIAVFTLMLFVGGTTYAFFNYTRTGAQNTVRTGTINFSSSETGNTVTLNNVFPVSASTIGTASESANDVRTVEITIDGNTTYNGGIEYVLTLDDVNIESNTTPKKEIPLSLNVTVEGLDSKTIGTPSDDYFTERGTNENPSTTAVYSILAKETAKQDEQILVGYIPKNVDVKGKVIVKAYIDASKVLITDTPAGNNSQTDGYTNGTDTTGKTVISTTEWNSIQNSPLSFKVKVEAREGIWVEEVRTVNAMNTFPTVITDEKTNIKEVYFNKMSSGTMQTAYNNATIKADLTYNNEGKVLAWLETNTTDNTKYNLIVASDGDTYLTTGNMLFDHWENVNRIEFNNVNTGRVTDLSGMFESCRSLTSLDLSNFDTDNVIHMSGMLSNCVNLIDVDLSNFDTDNVTSISSMFSGCTNLKELNLSSFNTVSIQNQGAFSAFMACSSLEKIYVDPNKWDISNQYSGMPIFGNNTSLVGTSPNGTTYAFTDYNTSDKTYAVIATDTTPGYLTDISLKPAN